LWARQLGPDDDVKHHPIAKCTNVDVVLGMIPDNDIEQSAKPLHCICPSVILFSSVFRSTPPEQTFAAAAMLYMQQRFWIEHLLYCLPALTIA
jgi:hypothetical protein